MSDDYTVAVIGAGASGVISAVALARTTRAEVVLIDPCEPGPGVPYRTTDERHRLNVPAGWMSALDDEPDDLVDWCNSVGHQVAADDYLSRRLYGDYLHALLRRFCPGDRVRWLRASVDSCSVQGDGVTLGLADGRTLSAACAVVAIGNPPLEPIAAGTVVDPRSVVENPWDPAALDVLASARSVVVVGTALTAADVALTAAGAPSGPRVTLVSRRGQLPERQIAGAYGNDVQLGLSPGTRLEEIVAEVRSAIDAHPADWRAVIDGLRPHVNRLWAALSVTERIEFEQLHRHWWDRHRHRLSPQSAKLLDEFIDSGVITVRAGGISGISAGLDGGVLVGFAGGLSVEFDVLVNATGPGREIRSGRTRLVRQLLASGLAIPDATGAGLRTSASGALVSAAGATSRRLYVVGPLRRGELFETTAIGELREQGPLVAEAIEGDARARAAAFSGQP